MCSARDDAALPAPGFPIRESAGHRLFSASPRLIAAVHALHRLLVPRHPPCALLILTVISRSLCELRPVIPVLGIAVQFSRSAERRPRRRERLPTAEPPADAGLSKLNSMQGTPLARRPCPDPVDVLGPAALPAAGMAVRERTGAPSLVLPRKEVIQP